MLLWREREKNNAWYIHLTSYQPPPNLHNLTSAWPVMLLANQRLPDGNQILVGIMSLSPKSILGKRKFLSTCRWRFLKKKFKYFFYLYLTATNNKEFTSSLTSFCGESSKKKLGWSIIFHSTVLWKRRSLRLIRRFLKEELQSNQVEIPFMNWLFEKWTRLSLL